MSMGFVLGVLVGSAMGKNCQKQPRLIGRDVALSRINRKDPTAGKNAIEFYELWDEIQMLVFNRVCFWTVTLSAILSVIPVLLCYAGLLSIPPFYPLYELTYFMTAIPIMIVFLPFVYLIIKTTSASKKTKFINELKRLVENNDKWIWEMMARFDPYTMEKISKLI